MKNLIGNRTRNLPTCSAVPRPTAPPRTPKFTYQTDNFSVFEYRCKLCESVIGQDEAREPAFSRYLQLGQVINP